MPKGQKGFDSDSSLIANINRHANDKARQKKQNAACQIARNAKAAKRMGNYKIFNRNKNKICLFAPPSFIKCVSDKYSVQLQVGAIYTIKNAESNQYVDGRCTNHLPIMTAFTKTSDRNLQWILIGCNDGFALKSVASGKYLNGRCNSHQQPLITNGDPTNDAYLQWNAVKVPAANIAIFLQNVSTKKFFDGCNQVIDEKDVTHVSKPSMQWVFEKVPYFFGGSVQNEFELKQILEYTKQKLFCAFPQNDDDDDTKHDDEVPTLKMSPKVVLIDGIIGFELSFHGDFDAIEDAAEYKSKLANVLSTKLKMKSENIEVRQLRKGSIVATVVFMSLGVWCYRSMTEDVAVETLKKKEEVEEEQLSQPMDEESEFDEAESDNAANEQLSQPMSDDDDD